MSRAEKRSDRAGRILELGCAQGDLLAALHPVRATGIDFSKEMIERASRKHPGLEFIQADAHDLSALRDKFDVIILSVEKILAAAHRTNIVKILM